MGKGIGVGPQRTQLRTILITNHIVEHWTRRPPLHGLFSLPDIGGGAPVDIVVLQSKWSITLPKGMW